MAIYSVHSGWRSAKRYKGCKPEIIRGRKVWVYRRSGGLPEIWVHASPWLEAPIYLVGSSLTEGDEAANQEYLEQCCRSVSEWPAMPKWLEKIWDEDKAEADANDEYYAREIADL